METNSADEDSVYTEVGNYYFTTESLQDVQFVVGEQPERIKAVRLPLINQSRIWWTMLSPDSLLAEKGEIRITDVEPQIFKLLLRHSYGGLENLDELSEDEILKLCYCANKYMMKTLMNKIAAHLQPTDVNNVFPALHCLVYFNLKGVEESVQKIVEKQTTEILKHPEFMECDVDSCTYICKQKSLDCDEVTVWNDVVQWAKHKAKCDEGPKLREWLLEPLKHIRFQTMCMGDLHEHVFSQDVLTGSEIANICKNVERRPTNLVRNVENACVVNISHQIKGSNNNYLDSKTSTSCFIVRNKSIKLQSFICRGNHIDCGHNDYVLVYKYSVNIKIKIARVTDLMTNTSSEEPKIIELTDFKYYSFNRFAVPTLINNEGFPLEANNKYKIEITFSKAFPSWSKADCVEGHVFDHGIFYCCQAYNSGVGLTPCHIFEFTYTVADDSQMRN